jgi:carbamoyltransferase
MHILGLNAYHGDSSACLVKDGQLLAAAEEERFRRIKHWAGFPSESIRYCLTEGGVKLSEIDYIAINRNPKANVWRKILFALRQRPSPSLIKDRLINAKHWMSVEDTLRTLFPDQPLAARLCHIEHHLAHLASAYLVSNFDQAVVVSVDGFGDFASAAWGIGREGRIRIDNKIYFPHSLGVYYQAMTQFLGFPHYGDEYKVMGLAAYGAPRYINEMRQIVRLIPKGTFELGLEFFRHHREQLGYTWENCSPSVGRLFSSALEHLLGPARKPEEPLLERHKDIARSTQAMYEEAFFYLLNSLHDKYRLDTLTLAGGCAMNSVANGKIYDQTPFKQVYIQSAAGDAGGAIGSAYVVSHRYNKASKRFHMDHAYWGPGFDNQDYEKLLNEYTRELDEQHCSIQRIDVEEELCHRTACAVASGKVVGWFQGRLEWGPRALGNRSIVCDPRAKDMKEILNSKIKRRESFRPFAPSILREAVPEWFEHDDDVFCMMKVFKIRESKRPLIPAVTHVDGSGRLQTVARDTNPRFYRLIEKFKDITGVPMVLNTSFNENEPVVCRPNEALNCFLRTQMDLLVLGNYYISRAT